MKRRSAILGILGITGLGVASYAGFNFFKGSTSHSRKTLPKYMELISELVDVIIPTTDTPGAKTANVQQYIVNYMEDCASHKEYNNFINGLNELQEECLNTYNSSFETCSMQQKVELIAHLDRNFDPSGILTKIDTKLRGRSFYNILKTLTIEGYCTSKIGATQHLAYVSIPANYEAITELQPNQKAWATK